MALISRRRLLAGFSGTGLAAASLATAEATSRSPLPAGNPVLGRDGGMHHTAIRTHDWERTLAFYKTVLGFEVKLAWQEVLGSMDERLGAGSSQPRNQRWAYLDSGGGACIEIFEDTGWGGPPPGTDPTNTPGSPIVHIGIRTSQLDRVWERARAHGAILGNGPTAYTLHTTSGQGPVVVRLAFLQGPSGEWIELIEHAP